MNQYLTELARVLARKDIKTAPIENGRLPILLGNYSIGHVEPSGTICLTPEDLQTPETSELYFRVVPIADMVREYMTAMEQAPPLHADGLDEEYKLLTEFNGTVLAGREMDGGYGMKFVTWDWSYGKTGLYRGLARKSSWTHITWMTTPLQKRTSPHAPAWFRKIACSTAPSSPKCIAVCNATLAWLWIRIDSGYELTAPQEKLIEETQKQIESAVPDLQEQIAQANEQGLQQNM